MEIQKLGTDEISEFKSLVQIFRLVFENTEAGPDDNHLKKLISNPDFLVFVVKIDGCVVGGLTIYVLNQYYSAKPLAYIYDVGMAPGYQGKGLGKALISEVCSYCKTNGFDDAYVEAESDDMDAVRFYRKTNFTREMNATHFTYSFD